MRLLPIAVTAATLGSLVLASAGGADTSRATSSISSVTFSRGSKAPRIVARGRDFGARPGYSPAYAPEQHQGCPAQKPAADGHDFGAALWFYDTKAAGGTTPVWRAGRYAGARELDCVGLIIDSWSATKVAFHFGSQYDRPSTSTAPSTYLISNGDPFVLRIGNATFRGTVRFG